MNDKDVCLKSVVHKKRVHCYTLYPISIVQIATPSCHFLLLASYLHLLHQLFQDLPNNMIHQVAIKTLPQEWLWCETWCDDASKQYAKTIDLVYILTIFYIMKTRANICISLFHFYICQVIFLLFCFSLLQCNNPMTKEAKLQAAMRILPEWIGYDEEIKALQQKIENANRQTEKERDNGMFLTKKKMYIYIYISITLYVTLLFALCFRNC